MSILVSIIESDSLGRNRLAELIDKSVGFCCASQHDSSEAALRELPGIAPAVILMDIHLPKNEGTEGIRRLKLILPATEIILLSDDNPVDLIFNSLAAGTTGYLLKQTVPDHLLQAIREVYAGGSPINSQVARKLVRAIQPPILSQDRTKLLSPRETQVLQLLNQGYRYQDIAETLQVSYTTIHTHIRHLYKKLQVRSRAEASCKTIVGLKLRTREPAAGLD